MKRKTTTNPVLIRVLTILVIVWLGIISYQCWTQYQDEANRREVKDYNERKAFCYEMQATKPAIAPKGE